MRFIVVFLLVFSASCFAAGGAEAQQPEAPVAVATVAPIPVVTATPLPDVGAVTAFDNGVGAFQKNDVAAARKWFIASLVKDPNQAAAWYDLGVSEQRLGNKGFAMAYLRKALNLMPSLRQAEKALAFTRRSLEKSDIPHEVETWESLHAGVLTAVSVYQFAFITLILFFIAAWTLLLYFGQRRRAKLDEKPLPMFPFLASFASLLFATFLILTVCKIIDAGDLRATVVTKKIEAKALPDASSTTLFELYEGLEVIVDQSRQGWVQVTYPGGATGWIPRTSVFTTADRITQ